MQQKDFIKLINLKAEYTEYIRFLSGKSQKYYAFADWETHIKSLLGDIDTSTDLYNLKRYCEHMVRSNNDTSQIFWGYIGLSFPLTLAFSTEEELTGFKGIATMILLMALLMYITIISKRNARKKHFYEDMLKVIDQLGTNTIT